MEETRSSETLKQMAERLDNVMRVVNNDETDNYQVNHAMQDAAGCWHTETNGSSWNDKYPQQRQEGAVTAMRSSPAAWKWDLPPTSLSEYVYDEVVEIGRDFVHQASKSRVAFWAKPNTINMSCYQNLFKNHQSRDLGGPRRKRLEIQTEKSKGSAKEESRRRRRHDSRETQEEKSRTMSKEISRSTKRPDSTTTIGAIGDRSRSHLNGCWIGHWGVQQTSFGTDRQAKERNPDLDLKRHNSIDSNKNGISQLKTNNEHSPHWVVGTTHNKNSSRKQAQQWTAEKLSQQAQAQQQQTPPPAYSAQKAATHQTPPALGLTNAPTPGKGCVESTSFLFAVAASSNHHLDLNHNGGQQRTGKSRRLVLSSSEPPPKSEGTFKK